MEGVALLHLFGLCDLSIVNMKIRQVKLNVNTTDI